MIDKVSLLPNSLSKHWGFIDRNGFFRAFFIFSRIGVRQRHILSDQLLAKRRKVNIPDAHALI